MPMRRSTRTTSWYWLIDTIGYANRIVAMNSQANPIAGMRNNVGQGRSCVSRAQRLRMIRSAITDNIGTDVSKVGDMLDHSLGGGKGFRALVAHISCDWCGMVRELCNEVAAAMEMIHLAALVHDDIIDSAMTRRDKSTVNHEFGSDAAVLAGDFLYSRASQLLCRVDSVALLAEIADATNTIAEGEVMQLNNKNRLPEREEYYETIRRKTAVLFSACAITGPVSMGQKEMVEPMRDFGMSLGMAFQITDDCIDYTGEESVTGKKPGMDFAEGKATLPMLCGMELAKGKTKRELKELWENHDDEGSFEKAREVLGSVGAIDKAKAMAKEMGDKASSSLAKLSGGDFHLVLKNLIERVSNRIR